MVTSHNDNWFSLIAAFRHFLSTSIKNICPHKSHLQITHVMWMGKFLYIYIQKDTVLYTDFVSADEIIYERKALNGDASIVFMWWLLSSLIVIVCEKVRSVYVAFLFCYESSFVQKNVYEQRFGGEEPFCVHILCFQFQWNLGHIVTVKGCCFCDDMQYV